MEEEAIVDDQPAQTEHVGARLKRAREEAGHDLAHVAAETRIPQRHLVTIEAGEFSKLPSRTYAVGFTRTYARMLGLDEHEMVDAVRAELASDEGPTKAAPAKFEPGDPAHVPGRGLAWFGVLAAVIFAAGIFTFYRSYFVPGVGPAPLIDERAEQPRAASAAAVRSARRSVPAASGPVVFTSTMDGTWVKFYDGSGERLYEAQMGKGESFTVPADAENPQIWTGRPYALDITVGGRMVPRLSEEDTVVKDVPVSAAALLARGDDAPAPAANGDPTAASASVDAAG